jgi:drug/metabolite transporter (DMT)-like permease
MKNLLPILLAVFCGVLYHVAQKSVPKQVSPLAAIMVAYAIGVLGCFLAMLFISRERPLLESSLAATNWAVWLVGISATVIEVSILLAYRAGWNIGVTSVIVNISVAVLLLPIGLAIFRERISSANTVGVVLCLFGLYLLSR